MVSGISLKNNLLNAFRSRLLIMADLYIFGIANALQGLMAVKVLS